MRIFIFIISLFWSFAPLQAQEENENTMPADSIVYNERYGLRLGVDLSKVGRTLTNKYYTGFAVEGDYRLNKRWYPAAELGYEDFSFTENYFAANSKGSYLKLGVNYNAYQNWIGMQNEIYAGLRYGFSTFTQSLNDFTVYDKDPYFDPDYRDYQEKFSGLSSHWIEFQLGVKAEVLHNVFLGIHVELKHLLSDKSPVTMENLWMPGFNRHYDGSEFGIGWGYSVSYLLPVFKKERKEKRK